MEGLKRVRGDQIIGRRLAGGRPVLGICVGMQILFEEGVEHGIRTKGCGEWPGVVERLRSEERRVGKGCGARSWKKSIASSSWAWNMSSRGETGSLQSGLGCWWAMKTAATEQ